MAIHSSDAKKQLADFHIGTLVGTPIPKKDEVDDRSGPFLSQTKWKKVQLVNIETLSKDAKIYRFALQRPDQELGLPIGQHVFVRLRRKVGCQGVDSVVEGELVQRAYTPISKQYHRGFIDLLIKCVPMVPRKQNTSGLSSYSIDIEYITQILNSLSAAV